MVITSKEEVQDFLNRCRETIPNSFLLDRRDKNRQTIRDLGINHKIVKEILLNLSEEDYADGPLEDRVYKGQVWIFGKLIDHQEIYIKLTLSAYNDPGDRIQTVYCISFHFAEHPLNYPFK